MHSCIKRSDTETEMLIAVSSSGETCEIVENLYCLVVYVSKHFFSITPNPFRLLMNTTYSGRRTDSAIFDVNQCVYGGIAAGLLKSFEINASLFVLYGILAPVSHLPPLVQ